MKVDLRTERLNRGMSAEAMAAAIGVKPHVVRYVEKTGARPHPANALAIANYFGLTVTEMWPGDEEPAAA